jgi:YHS domain-containing protein
MVFQRGCSSGNYKKLKRLIIRRGKMVKDPICGMEVDPKTAKFKAAGHYFCSKGCMDTFLGKKEEAKVPVK